MKLSEFNKEYTGPRTCDLCEYGRNLPCKNKGCNSANGLKDFKLRGTGTEATGWEIISFTWDKSDDHLLINLRDKTGTVIMVTLSPDNIADMGLAQ